MKKCFLINMITSTLCLLTLGGCGQIASHEEAVMAVKNSPDTDNIVARSWQSAAESAAVDDGWLKSFNDPQLMEIVDEAQKHNFGLKIAEAQVEQANALAIQAGASLKPTVGLSGGYGERNSESSRQLYGGGFKISWEADVWGRLRSGAAAAEESAAAVESDFEFARQSLAAAAASGWFVAVGSKILFDDSVEIVRLLQKSVEIAEKKEVIGQIGMKEVHLVRADAAAAEEASRQAQAAGEEARRSLELLLGRYPGATIETTSELVAVPPPVSAGIPSQLLERRPDLIAAEQRVAAAFYKQKEAELMHLPRFTFSVGIGINSLTDAISGLAAGIFAPLYTGGAIEAEVERATAEQKQVIADYGQTALEAFKEVETALANEEHFQKRESYLEKVVEENFKVYEIMQKQFEIGMIDLLDVLAVQNKWIQARIALVDVSTMRLLNRVRLHLALGGGFE